MPSQLRILTRLCIGACTEGEAAAALDVSIAEIQRLRCAVAGERITLVPIAFDLQSQRFEFLDLEGATCREPFFSETINQVQRARPDALNFEVDCEDFLRGAERHQRPPEGFLFHVGRCGSTLLANMLSASGEYLLIKEPELVNDLIAAWLNTHDDGVRGEIERLLGAAIRYLLGTVSAARREARLSDRVLKLSAWNVRLGRILLDLFPSTPAVFVYRSPSETVASLLFRPPPWFDFIERPRSIQRRFFPTLGEVPDGAKLSAVTLFAHAWRSAVDAALALSRERLLVLGYEELIGNPEAVLRSVLSHFHHRLDASLIGKMAAVLVTYSKDPTHQVLFEPTGKHRRPPLSPQQADEVRAITADSYQRLVARADPFFT